jgi:hypothetical protein
VFQGDRPKDYSFITEDSDKNDNIRTPAAANITEEMRQIIPLTPEWTHWPDYDRASSFFNRQTAARTAVSHHLLT